MSAILMTVATLYEGRSPEDICNVELKDENCGGSLLCHLPNKVMNTSVIDGMDISSEHFPRRWLCPAHLLQKFQEKEQAALTLALAGHDPLAAYFPGPTATMLERAARTKESSITSDELPVESGVTGLIRHLEDNGFYCYNLIWRNQPAPPVLLYTYTHPDKGVTVFLYVSPGNRELIIARTAVFVNEHSSWRALQHFYRGGDLLH